MPVGGSSLPVLVKSFGKQSAAKDWIDLRFRTSKAARSFDAAMHLCAHGVTTPEPIAYLEKRQKNRLLESYFLSVFQEGSTDLQSALLYLLHNEATSTQILDLLKQIARQCRGMHDAGFQHFDLGNQNILLQPETERSWLPAGVIDLNRGRVLPELNLTQRGQDLSRLNLPSNLMAMFLDMYWGAPAPLELVRGHKRYRDRFARRVRTRKLRHPFREARIARESKSLPPSQFFPHPRDIWIWDDTSDQALSALDRRERVRQYPSGRSLRLLGDTLLAAPGIWRAYRQAKATAFTQQVSLQNRVGLALAPTPQSQEREMELLRSLGPIPVLLRINHHESNANHEFQVQQIKRLRAAGHDVTVAMVQDRQAILQPARWQEFVLNTLAEIASDLVAIEFGHAINRVKWGIWDFRELHSFYGVLKEVRRRFPELEILGPATIDFEYPFLISALKEWPQSVPLAAVSHHLYVDRRGAPENQQNGFSALEKFALAKAVAAKSPMSSGEVIVSEVNWPVAGTGVYSPVTAPFEYDSAPPGSIHDSGIDEESYAYYMVRYLALALCSGLVGQVFWWRLVARGYGLVDIADEGQFRERPAFYALRQFLQTLGEASVVEANIPTGHKENHGEYRIQLRRADSERILLCWRHGPGTAFPKDVTGSLFEDCFGNALPEKPVELQGSPVYVRHYKGPGL